MTTTFTEMMLVLSQWVDVSILSKATLVLLLGLTATSLAKGKRASVRHLVLAAMFAALLALPLAVLTAPAVTIEVPVSSTSDSNAASDTALRATPVVPPSGADPGHRTQETSLGSVLSWHSMARWGWLSGSLLLLGSLALDSWRLRRVRRDGLPWPDLRDWIQSLAKECGVRRDVEILLHDEVLAPLTCGMWRTAIVLPTDAREWSEADLRRALIHELEHARRCDWVIQLTARAICAVYWFHPLVWMAWRRLSLEAERACDDAVVQGGEPSEYAEQLVLLARRMAKERTQPALGMANRSDLSTRVYALLDAGQRRGRAGLLAITAAISIASLVVIAIAPLRAVAQSRDRASVRQSRSTAFDRALLEAAESGDIPSINAILSSGANVNCAISGDGTPLIVAARNGHLAVARLLLDRGADPNMPVRGDGNPIIMAAREGHVEVVTLLLDRGASIDQMVQEDENALIQASGSGHLHVVKMLLTRGADINVRAWTNSNGGEWRTPLSMARRGGHDAVVALLLASGARA